ISRCQKGRLALFFHLGNSKPATWSVSVPASNPAPNRNTHAQSLAHRRLRQPQRTPAQTAPAHRSEEHTSELQSLMRISYAVFCLTKKNFRTQTSNSSTK